MTRAVLIAIALMSSARIAHADPDPAPATDDDPDGHIAKAREYHDVGDFEHARQELLAAYEARPKPELLFALGQIEFNLHHYQQALDYYEKYSATNPPPDQLAVVQQAMGATRMELSRPKPLPPRPPPHREWDGVDTGLVIGGGVAIGGAIGLAIYARGLVEDRSGSLNDYDHRVGHAENARWLGAGVAGVGVIAIGAAIIRYRLHMVETTIDVQPTAGGATVTLEHRL